MTIRGTLLGIGGGLWLAALGCWLRARGSGRLARESVLFLLLGLPFLIAGGFYTESSYPPEAATPAPAPVLARATPVATPRPEREPATYQEAVIRAQRRAVERHPELGRAGTPFNSRFLAAYRRLQLENPNYFSDPEWPLHLADEIARTAEPPR